MALSIDLLIPTQRRVRNCAQVGPMVAFVKEGGIFDRGSLDLFAQEKSIRPSPLIQISRFEDGDLYLHDGMHRCYAIYKADRSELLESEYQITDWRYADYLAVNVEKGWITPFDPRTEIRKEELSYWKSAFDVWMTHSVGEERNPNIEEIETYVRASKDFFVEPRGKIRHVWDIDIP